MSDNETNEKTLTTESTTLSVQDQNNGKVDVSIDIPRNEYVICKVCGHKNKADAGMC